MGEAVEKKNKRISFFLTTSCYLILLLLLYFSVAWQAPDPPLPEYGIELNFGLSSTGSGEIKKPDPKPVENVEEQIEEEAPPQESEEIEPVEEIVPEVVEETVEETVETSETLDVPSPDYQEEKLEEVKVEQEKPLEEAKNTNQAVEEEPSTEVASGKSGEAKEAESSSQGDDEEEAGDKGNKNGTVDARALMGTPGTADGSSLEMTGWVWDFHPQPDDDSSESGRIVFQIKIDDAGEIISVRTLEKTVSALVEKKYRAAVEELTFSPTSENTIPAPTSTGKITFIIKTQ
ncbi:hypothetical protein [Xanthovirga aplysinae]|uniref:hypothetical protein n=1 Tax=Xanthovirga aplysinae TaxID=2529853 RepID=UPI0012BD7CCD|nr:hypothetical protein [Xanthovirga aplysinae]MTI30118.1 hypothetical protein [Xanthovirga aplysinae]